MAFTVRIFGHTGLTRMKVLGAQQLSTDSVFQLQQPYLWNQAVVTNAATPVSSVAGVPAGGQPDNTDVLRIEVPDGQTIRYEVNPPARPGGVVAANVNSPAMSGRDIIKFGAGWTLSIIDAAAVAP